jgi:hypothetical protein
MLKAFQWQNATLFKKKKKVFVQLVSGGEPGDGFSVWVATTPSGFGNKLFNKMIYASWLENLETKILLMRI